MQNNLLLWCSVRSKHSWCLFCEVVQISNYMTPFTQRFCGLFLNILSIITQLYSKVGQRQMLADAVISNILVLNMLNSQITSICNICVVSHLSDPGSLDNEQLRTILRVVHYPIQGQNLNCFSTVLLVYGCWCYLLR